MRKLTVTLTASLAAEWGFTHLGDFERAGAAGLALLRARRMVDVDDLQALLDTIADVFEAQPPQGNMTFAFVHVEEAVVA